MKARLHRRLFVWLGLAIVVTAGVTASLQHVLGHRPGPIALVVGGIVLWMVAGIIARRLTRPLWQLVEVTRDIGAGKLDARMKLGRFPHGEVGVIGRAVNDMAERIEKQIADQRELLAAVSHELRTPLAHMRVLIDTARAKTNDAHLLDELESEVLEIDRLVDQLLASSRLEFQHVHRGPIDAAELASRALERAGVDATSLDIDTDDNMCEGDATLILRAIGNLVQNAEAHGGGLSRLRVSRVDDHVRFEAEDRGPGISPEIGRHMFESFFRGEHRAGGSLGLGLALVRRIAEAHGGTVFAAAREGGGARVGFSIPVRR